MGCTSSKDSVINPSFPSNPSPLLLTKSLSLVHHPPLCKGDSHHLVSLTSTTYGSLHLIQNPLPNSLKKDSSINQNLEPKIQETLKEDSSIIQYPQSKSKENLQEDPSIIQNPQSKTLENLQEDSSIIQSIQPQTLETLQEDSSIIQNPVPKIEQTLQEDSSIIQNPQPESKETDQEDSSITQNPQPQTLETHQEDPSIINTWELMAGLEDNSPKPISTIPRSFAFNANPNLHLHDSPKKDNHKSPTPPPSFLDNSNPYFSQSPSKPLWKHLSEESLLADMDPIVGSFRRSASSKHHQMKSPLNSPNLLRTKTLASRISPLDNINQIRLPGAEARVVLYFTSLRGIRRTYEDCCIVRNIFAGFRVQVDERDISMDATFRTELQNVLGQKTPSLPRVFIGGKYVGGVEEIKQLHEMGELAKLLNGFPVRAPGVVCESCGDARFIPCANCNGSRKVFEEDEGQLRRCLECNENGLIRCPYCCC
ncbi:glutaredoxin family protein [Tasmannia lanceolata]|uniref:glutaredoxin family protein n=1 Tax=Tasmannia lanceolata TaxID=3420 RepID=UPI004064AD66